jgi:hypothetical protein
VHITGDIDVHAAADGRPNFAGIRFNRIRTSVAHAV